MFEVTVLWGECPQPEDTPMTYTFNTQAELDAFNKGVDAAVGWMDVHVLEPGDTYCFSCNTVVEGDCTSCNEED